MVKKSDKAKDVKKAEGKGKKKAKPKKATLKKARGKVEKEKGVKEVKKEKKKAKPKKATLKKARGKVEKEKGVKEVKKEGKVEKEKGVKEVKKEGKVEKEKGVKEVKKEKRIEKIKFHGRRDISDVLKLRKKKPRFMRQELPKLKRLKDKWRRPRGIDSKKQEGKRGKGKLPKIGYKKPASVREIHPSGFYPVLVHNVKELTLINPEEEAAIIARSIGRRKRNEIIRSANELKITILNPRKGEL